MKNSAFTCRNLHRFQGAFIFFIASVSYIVNVDAQLSWGANGAGGDGTWDSATPNWSDGTNNVPWVNGGSAAFGGTAGTVSISGSVTASTVTFGVPGYVLQGDQLISAPGGLTIQADADTTVNSVIAGPTGRTGAFTKTGLGTLTIARGFYSFGRVTVDGGELSLINATAAGLVSLASTGATLTLGDANFLGLSGGGIVQPGAGVGAKTLYIYGSGGTFSGSIRDNSGASLSFSKSGTGLEQLTGINTYTGSTAISGGTLALVENGSIQTSAVNMNGGTLLLDNFAITVADRIPDTAPISLSAGTIVLKGNSAVPSTESLGALTVGNNPVSVVVNPNPAQLTALTFASLNPRAGNQLGVITFSGPALGRAPGPGVASILFKNPPVLMGGSDLHPAAAILTGALGTGASGSTFVTYGANGIRPLDDAEFARDLATVSSWENADIGSAQSISSDTTVNALRLRNGAAIGGSGSLAVKSGVILTLPGNANMTVGALDFDAREILFINEGNLAITGRVTSPSTSLGLTKTGAGRLTLAGPNTFAGSINVLQGVLRLQNSTGLGTGVRFTVRSGAAIELAGGVSIENSTWSIFGTGPDGRGGLRSLSGNNRIGFLQSNASSIDVASGSLTATGIINYSALTKTGAGTLTVTGTVINGKGTSTVSGGALVLTLDNGSPLGSSGMTLNGSTLLFAPVLSKPGALLALSSLGPFTYQGGTSTLALDKGGNAGVTLTFGSSFVRTSPGTLIVAPAGGLAALGVTEKIKLNSTLDTAFPTVNGIVAASIIGQDTDANRSGDFLGYTAATGLRRATFSTNTNLNTPSGNQPPVFNATTPQTLTANASIYALKNSGQMIDLAGRTLTVGATDRLSGGIILNGGSITGGELVLTGTTTQSIYTSLAGGRIASRIVTGGTALTARLAKFGPGKLTLSGSNSANIFVESGTLQLDSAPTQFSGPLARDVSVVPGATFSGTGGISGAISGGLISPGVGTGILHADRIGRLDTTLYGFDPSFDVSSFAFEFVHVAGPVFGSSDSDVLRLSSATRPFESFLRAADEIDIYFAGGTFPGAVFRGGFFTDRNASFLDEIDDAKFRYFVKDAAGGTVFNDRTYRERTDLPVEIGSVPQTANFGTGDVNGYIMEIRVVPEPSALLLLLAASLALWSGSMNGRSAHGSRFPRTRKKRADAGM